jgi:hypothetical protein
MIAFVDLEFGVINGSTWRRDYVPSELGVLLLDPRTDELEFFAERFDSGIDLVLRRNVVDARGKVIGVAERVANFEQGVFDKPFDPAFRLGSREKSIARRAGQAQYRRLLSRLTSILPAKQVRTIVFFGMREDQVVLSRAGFDLTRYQVVDLQDEIRLDRLGLAIDFRVHGSRFLSRNFSHPFPAKYRHVMKPHRAVCDATRIYLVQREMNTDPNKFLLGCLKYAPPPDRVEALKTPSS